MKKAREARAFFIAAIAGGQFRSARARRVAFLLPVPVPAAIVVEPVPLAVAPAVEPELIEPEEAAPVLPAVEPAAEPCAAAPPPPGVPVVPIGVFCVLRWPAPTAGLVAGCGGVDWAKARLAVAATTAAARNLSEDIFRTPWM
jgi:hypothetical protein